MQKKFAFLELRSSICQEKLVHSSLGKTSGSLLSDLEVGGRAQKFWKKKKFLTQPVVEFVYKQSLNATPLPRHLSPS